MDTTDGVSAYSIRSWRMRIELNDRHYAGMKKLKLRGKDLDNPPREVFHLTELQVLDLSPERQACLYYHLRVVPPRIARLLNLRVLMLDTNDLTQIPPEIGMLTSLEKLSLSNNVLSKLPTEFGNLQNLTSLHAANNSFEMFPAVVCTLKSVTFMDFSDNLLITLPDSLGDMVCLESLLLFSNRLQSLPASLGALAQLRCLWIGQNRLRALPPSVAQLQLLDWGPTHTWSSALDGNPLEEPPLDVCKRGVTSIAEYFKNNHAAAGNETHESE